MEQYRPGDRIGGEYTVLDVFGGESRSGMGVVYLVQNREIPRPIVLKTFQRTLSSDAKRQFTSEAQAWIRAGAHPNIVKAYWVREIVDQMFVAAEYVEPDDEGRNNMTQYLNAGQLRVEIVLLWASQFCHGMDYAKSRGVLAHRDIKPDNLMIDGTASLKVTDFGLAKSIDLNGPPQPQGWRPFGRKLPKEPISATITGSAMGTLPYMAPEQFIDAKAVDHRADIYSFGIILYQMAAGGRYPYRISSDAPDVSAEFLRAHRFETPLPIDSPLLQVINRCLQKAPNRRYATYDALLNDLSAVATELQIKLPKAVHVAKEDEELYAQAQSYVALGDSDRALKAIDEYVAKYPENECGWTEKGRIHYERGEYAQGLVSTRKSLDVNPYNTHAWNNLGILLNRKAAPIEEVERAFESALRFDPYNTAAMVNLIGPLVLNKEFSKAATLAARAMKLRPDKPLVLQKAEALLKEFFGMKQPGAAETLLSAWTGSRPTDADAWHNLGLISLDKDDVAHAIRCFEHVHELSTKDDFAVIQLAKLNFQMKHAPECLKFCNELLQRGLEPLLAVSLKARTLNFADGYEQALNFLQPYLDHNPENDALWVVLAEIHEYHHNYVAAINALRSAQRLLSETETANGKKNLRHVDQKLQALSAMNGVGREVK